ncbi:PQQ-dependent sugar dehydrogenase [Thioalkalivibrio sp. ALJ24]|uniref:PQQ-dependent sugar dehydrogenase n=1 Tax=Thioalkalivibrio sp. ALJ24 TaxID=545276 RepID=UPI00036B7CA2|nr:PQQ-dependent sugar dehydrogenase [Thioalkalivibrio sp. ALJ24]
MTNSANSAPVLRRGLAGLLAGSFLLAGCSGASAPSPDALEASADGLSVEVLHDALDHPWAIAFLPKGGALISERSGTLRHFPAGDDGPDFSGRGELVSGLPDDLRARNQGGLLDLALHPDFADNRWLYFTYAASVDGGLTTRLARGRFEDGALSDVETLFTAEPGVRGGRHFGSRIVFDDTGRVFVSVGDRGDRDQAQDPSNHIGTIVRVHDDGSVPDDNPFVGDDARRDEIWAYGVRNSQGMVMDSETGILWENQHGPRGGDEINIIEAGNNYGWPVISQGEEYSGGPVGEGLTEKEGMVSPLHHWTPAIAPSGLAVIRDPAFAEWDGDLLTGGLAGRTLLRLSFEDRELVNEDEVLPGLDRRVRDVRVHDGAIWVLTDHNPGELLRLRPAGDNGSE